MNNAGLLGQQLWTARKVITRHYCYDALFLFFALVIPLVSRIIVVLLLIYLLQHDWFNWFQRWTYDLKWLFFQFKGN